MIRVAPRNEPDPLQRAGLGDASLEDMHAVLGYGHPVEDDDASEDDVSLARSEVRCARRVHGDCYTPSATER